MLRSTLAPAALAALLVCGCTGLAGLDALQFGTGGALAAGGAGGAAGLGGAEGGAGATSDYAALVLGDDPVAYWPLGEPAGSAMAIDATGNGYDGLVLGGVTLGVEGVVPGDGAARFDGARGAMVAMGDVLDWPGEPFTVEAWIKPQSIDADERWGIVSKRQGGDDDQGYTLRLNLDGAPQFTFWRDDVQFGADVQSPPPTDGFTHLAGVFDGRQLTLYIGGVGLPTGVVDAPLLETSAPFLLGDDGQNETFDGIIDEVAVYDRALPSATIAAHTDALSR